MKNLLVFWCLFTFTNVAAQHTTVLVSMPVQLNQVETSGKVRRLLKNSGLTADSMMIKLNQTIQAHFNHKINDYRLVNSSDVLLKTMLDSSEIIKMLPSSHLEKLAATKGFKKLQISNHNSGRIHYQGRHFFPIAIEAGKADLLKNNAVYFILLNKIDIKYSGNSGFVIHYEIYDSTFNRVYGDRFDHFLKLSGDMYFSTFMFYLNYCLENFSTELSSNLNKIQNKR